MSQSEKRPSQRAYLLRCWPEGDPDKGNVTWRFALEHVMDGERRRIGFASLPRLFTFLENELHSPTTSES